MRRDRGVCDPAGTEVPGPAGHTALPHRQKTTYRCLPDDRRQADTRWRKRSTNGEFDYYTSVPGSLVKRHLPTALGCGPGKGSVIITSVERQGEIEEYTTSQIVPGFIPRRTGPKGRSCTRSIRTGSTMEIPPMTWRPRVLLYRRYLRPGKGLEKYPATMGVRRILRR